MRGRDLLEKMQLADMAYIEEVDAISREKKRRQVMQYGALAACACLVILFSALLLPRLLKKTPVVTPTGDPFTVENGVLLSYTGNETEVVIPDNVIEIAANALSASPVAGQITAVTLGKNVQNIDELTFAGLASLSSVVVPEENVYYEYADGVLGKKDGTVYISLTKDTLYLPDAAYGTYGVQEVLSDLLYRMNNGALPKADISCLVIGPAVLETGWLSTETDEQFCLLAITVGGQRVDFESPIVNPYGGSYISLFYADGITVFSGAGYGRTTCCFGDGFVYTNFDENYDYTDTHFLDRLLRVILGEDGHLRYTKTARRYRPSQLGYSDFEYMTSRDDFWQEEGALSFEDGEPVFAAETVKTISDKYEGGLYGSLDGLFYVWGHEWAPDGLPWETLDELLEENRVRYAEYLAENEKIKGEVSC